MASKKKAKAEPKGPAPESLGFLRQRPLFVEDLTPEEDARLNQKRIEHTSSIPERNQVLHEKFVEAYDNPATPPATRDTARKMIGVTAAIQPHLRPVAETREQAAERISRRLTHPNPAVRLTSEPVVPGAAWYPEHNEEIRQAGRGSSVPFVAQTVASGSMSPLNSPTKEVNALRAMVEATDTDAKTLITPTLAKHLRRAVSRKASKTSAAINGADLLPDHHVGREVGFNELHPEVVAALTTTATGRQFKRLKTELDLPGIKDAGTNKAKGIRGLRGESNNSLNPPGSAPKVNTYTHNGLVFDDTTHPGLKDEIEFRAADTVRRARGEDLDAKATSQGLTPEEHQERLNLPGRYTGRWADKVDESGQVTARGETYHAQDVPLDFTGTHDDTFTMTPHLARHVKASGGVVHQDSVGQQVRMRDQHPATVMALSHPASPDHHVQMLATLSSQHPTVQDSWANAEVHDQPNISTGKTSVRKAGGSELLGYWSRKTLDSGESILDKGRDELGLAKKEAIQHADYDKITRMAAQHTRDKLDLPYDYPSTAAQAAPWTEQRREVPGNRDREYSEARAKERPRSQPEAPQGHSEVHGQADLFGGVVNNPRPVPAVVQQHIDLSNSWGATFEGEDADEHTDKDYQVANIIAGNRQAKRIQQSFENNLGRGRFHPVHGPIWPGHPKYHEAS